MTAATNFPKSNIDDFRKLGIINDSQRAVNTKIPNHLLRYNTNIVLGNRFHRVALIRRNLART